MRKKEEEMNTNFDFGVCVEEYLSTLDIITFTCMMKRPIEER